MKTIFFIFVMILSLSSANTMAATKEDSDKSYNLQRGMELMEQKNFAEAKRYLQSEISDHPKNGIAYLMLSLVQTEEGENGYALENVNKALQYISKKDKEKMAFAYATRSQIFNRLGEDEKELSDLDMAIKLQPLEGDYYESRAGYFYRKGDYERSNSDYLKLTELKPGDVMGYMGLGRNACSRGLYEEAEKQYSYVMKLSPKYSSAYSFRAEAYRKHGKYNEALEDCLTAIKLDYDQKAVYEFRETAESAFSLAEIKIKSQIKKNPSDSYWYYLMGVINQDAENHRAATQYYLKAADYDSDSRLLYWAAMEAEEYGDYKLSVNLLTRVYERDTTNVAVLFARGHIEERYGMVQESLRDFDTYIEANPEDGNAYHQRGWLKDKNGMSVEEALEDYTTAIGLDPDYTYTYLCRGQIFKRQGNMDAAVKDFEMVLKQDTVFKDNDNAIRQYALFYLGRVEEAKAWQDSILGDNPNKGDYYDAACLYSLMGEKEKSIEYLRKSLESGFRRFAHIRRDYDLDNIRNESAFIDLINEYEMKYESEQKQDQPEAESSMGETVEIPFSKERGVCKVNCSINGLPLYFIFDTGASDVSLSQVEANFMMKNDYLSSKDISGTQYYRTATGDVSEGTVVVLREVNFGGVTLQNVKASVVKNQKAPLLLGQSVLSRLGRIEIDNANKVIKIQK